MRGWLVAPLLTLPFAFASTAHAQSHPRIARANETYVLIEGPNTATLEMLVGSEFRAVCTAPCDRPFA
ncbi:MAG: hypothetical protein ACRELY_29070, partial [Polyangiaceae bacterium]